MSKLTAKQMKQKKELATKIMNHKGINYKEWLYEQHETYINENIDELIHFMDEQEKNNENDKYNDKGGF